MLIGGKYLWLESKVICKNQEEKKRCDLKLLSNRIESEPILYVGNVNSVNRPNPNLSGSPERIRI